MAQKRDLAAEKARKQKIMLAVAGVVLVGLGAIQVPKLMKGSSEPAAAPAPAAAVTPTPTPTPTPTSPGAVAPTATKAKPVAFVAGVGLPGTPVASAAKSQLASFTLFQPNDPFVQQVSDEAAAAAADSSGTVKPAKDTGGNAAPAADVPTASSGGSTATDGGGSSPAADKPAITYATVDFDGKPEQLQVKEKFPKADPMFVLVSLKKKQAKIGVAGGTFDDGGGTVTLKLGKKVTLLNTATGVRYELKLVYTGSEPETIESFTTKDGQQTAPADGSTAAPADGAAATTTSTSTP